jgi:SAM-dependent methyltransferase
MSLQVLELPADQYQRYKIVQDAVNLLRNSDRPFKILDVGGHPGHILDFLPKDEITIVDQLECDLPQYMKADALDLPFDRESFDVVVTTDVLEHIHQENRNRFLKELCRVSKQYVILAAPFSDPQVAAAEQILFEFIKYRLRYEHHFLKEHFQYGLPKLNNTIAFLQTQFGESVSIPNGYLINWLMTMIADFYCDMDPKLSDLKKRINRYYNQYYYPYDNYAPCYRHVLISAKGGLEPFRRESLTNLMSKRDGVPSPNFSMISAMVEFTNLDLLKESYQGLAQLQARIKELELHTQALTDQNKGLTQHNTHLFEEKGRLIEENAQLRLELNKVRSLLPFRIYRGLKQVYRKIMGR